MIFVIVLGCQTDGLTRMSEVIGVIGSVREANVGLSLTIIKHDGPCPYSPAGLVRREMTEERNGL